jgi:hypothetical protein
VEGIHHDRLSFDEAEILIISIAANSARDKGSRETNAGKRLPPLTSLTLLPIGTPLTCGRPTGGPFLSRPILYLFFEE